MPVHCSAKQYWQDLLWAINSPNLIRDDWFAGAHCNVPLTLPEQAHTPALEAKLANTVQATASNRLGHYFETLWIFFLEELSDWQVITSNQQIYDPIQKNTAGAFDLLVKSPEGDIEHWELAVKFYLGVKDQTRNINWVGPNKVDNFQRKLSHLTKHQLKLSQHPAGASWLAEQNIQVSRTRAIAKGILFYRHNPIAPTASHELHSRGQWMTESEWRASHGDYHQRPRAHWLGARQPQELLCAEDYNFSQPVLFSEFNGDTELRRVFVVDDNWEATL